MGEVAQYSFMVEKGDYESHPPPQILEDFTCSDRYNLDAC